MTAEVAFESDMRTQEQTRPAESEVAALAARQHGVVSRCQLITMGFPAGAIGRRLRAGRLHRLHPGVYAVGHAALTRHGRWMAAVLARGPDAALSHRSAAALWGIRPHPSGAVEVTTPRKSRSDGGIRRHTAVLPDDEVTTEYGIPVTTAPRTIFDLAATSSVDVVESALRQAEYLRLHDRLSLPHLLERYPHRRGVRAVRECLTRRAESPGRTRSPLEERFLPFLRQHRLPLPRLNVRVDACGHIYEVDCLWTGPRQVVELDGYTAHGTRGAFREDRARDRRLRVAGYGVTRLSWAQLDDEPEAIASDLRRLLAETKSA